MGRCRARTARERTVAEVAGEVAAHDSRHRRAEEPQLRVVDQDPPADMDQPVHVVAVGVSGTTSETSSSSRPAPAIAAGSSCSGVTCIRANGTFRAAAVSPCRRVAEPRRARSPSNGLAATLRTRRAGTGPAAGARHRGTGSCA